MKILIADDHDLMRETLAAFLVREPDFEIDVASDLPDAIEKINHLLFTARVDAERVRGAARSRDLIDQRLQLVTVPAHNAGDKSFARKLFCDGAARCIPSPDNQRNLRRHNTAPSPKPAHRLT